MKKRIVSFVLSVLMLLSLIPATAFAAEEDKVSISIENVTASAGETVSVPVTISNADSAKFANMSLTFSVSEGLSITGATIGAEASAVGMSISENCDVTTGVIIVKGGSGGSSPADGTLLTLTVNVDAAASGTIQITVGPTDGDEGNISDYDENDVPCSFAHGTITVSSAGEDDPVIPTNETYTANLGLPTGASTAVKVGDTVTVDVLVGGTTKEFASSELNLTYSGLTYVSGSSTVNGADVTAANGTIKIIDHGDSTSWVDGGNVTAYSLVFTVDAITGGSGTASVTLSDAALSTAANASGSNLTAATVTVNTKEFTVTPADLSVTLPEGLASTDTGNTVVYGEDFEFEATNKNYTYTLSAVVTGTETPVTITNVSDGKWKIENVTSNVTVTITKQEAKTYTITFTHKDHIQNQTTDTVSFVYGTEGGFSFILKDDVAASTTAGTQYKVDSIKYADGSNVSYTSPSTTTNRTYTIASDAITGNITITTSTETVNPNQFTITLPSEYTELIVDKTVVDMNGSVVLTLDPVSGYKYTVKYKIGESDEVTITDWTETDATDDDKLTYTISNITANVTVSVTKEVDSSKITATVAEYLALNGKTMYLVQVTSKLDSGYVYTYGGSAMYYSNEYNKDNGGAYVYLVINDADDTLTNDEALAQISIAQGNVAATVDYSGDVNMATPTKVDANDAQLVWNMYSAKTYSDFTTVNMEKFLRADVDKDGDVDVDDASAIVTLVKNRATN